MKKFILAFILFMCNLALLAQIQITKADLEIAFSPGACWVKSLCDDYYMKMDLGNSNGSKQNWSVPNVSWYDSLTSINVSAQNTPFFSYFPTATHAQFATGNINGSWADAYYKYFRLDSNALYVLGDVKSNQRPNYYSVTVNTSEQILFTLPLTIGATISSSRDSIETDTGYDILSNTQSVDAWGTLKFSFGDFDALRIKKHTELKEYFKDSVVTVYSKNTFTWIAKNGGMFRADLNSNLTSGIVFLNYIEMTQFNATTSAEEKGDNISPTEFMLSQNYPNPFNPSTKISWQSPVSGHQTLKVFDELGNEVATLVDEYKEAGRFEVNFDASKLSSGIYFYKLQAGSFVETKKMILMK